MFQYASFIFNKYQPNVSTHGTEYIQNFETKNIKPFKCCSCGKAIQQRYVSSGITRCEQQLSWHFCWTVGDTTSRSRDIPSKETHNFIPKQNVVYNSKPPPLSTQQNTTIHSLATAHFLPVAVLTTIFHCRLLWCTSYKQSSRTHLHNLVLSHFHSNIIIQFCNTGRSDTKLTHWTYGEPHLSPSGGRHWCCITTTLMSVIKLWALLSAFVSLLYYFHSLPIHASAPLWVNSQWWALYCSPIMTPFRTPPIVNPSLSHIFTLVHHLFHLSTPLGILHGVTGS